jgi:hypothetical protein
MTDFAKAERAYIYHTSVLVAVVAMAVASPVFPLGRGPAGCALSWVVRRRLTQDWRCRILAK